MRSRSSPVAGTTIIKGLDDPSNYSLSRILSRDPGGLAAALRQIGLGLQNLASAMGSAESSSPVAGPPFPSSTAPLTVGDLVNEFLRSRARADRSDRYIRSLRVSLGAFARGRRGTQAAAVTAGELERWLDRGGWGIRTRRNYLADVRTMYSWAIKRDLLVKNPAATVELPPLPAALPSLHTPDQVRATLEFARKYDLNICRAMAVKYFAGLRSSEVNLLEEQEIGELYIEVTAAKAKTRKRRLVSVQPNLSAWLALGGELPIRDQSNRWRWFTDALLEKTGVPWPKNVTRHTFVSYYLAKFQNAAKAALEAGHTEQMLFANYREITTREAAEQFWAIVPK
jgi:hypothetical protein